MRKLRLAKHCGVRTLGNLGESGHMGSTTVVVVMCSSSNNVLAKGPYRAHASPEKPPLLNTPLIEQG